MRQTRMKVMSHLKPRIGSNQCVCGGCGEPFNSVGAFDKHQTITKGVLKCIDPRKLGMLKNEHGWWCMTLKGEGADE